MKSPPTLYVIDAFAQFFRAYHAIRSPMSSPVTKEPTNMTFGFVGMLLKLLRGEGKISADGGSADYIAVALDVSGDKETFRSTLYPEYKAHRPPPPEDLMPQVERALSILRAIGVPILGMEGFEADDVIATIVSQLAAEHPDVRIRFISKDKDLKQLLRAGGGEPSDETNRQGAATPAAPIAPVEMYDIHTDELATVTTLHAETGLRPQQVIDMLALMGDTVDNVPGVEGIGPKTAAQLIAQYGSLDALLARSAEIKGKRGEALRQTADRLPLSRTLVTLRHDVPVRLELDAARRDALKIEALMPILKELGFNRYQDELKALMNPSDNAEIKSDGPGNTSDAARTDTGARQDGAFLPTARRSTSQVVKRSNSEPIGGLFDTLANPDAASSAATNAASTLTAPTRIDGSDYRCVTTREQLSELVVRMTAASIISIDTETTHLSPLRCKLCGISVSVTPHAGYYIPVRSPNPEQHLDEATVLNALRPIFEDPSRPKTGHNLKYDLLVFRKHGIALRGLARPVRKEQSDAALPLTASSESKADTCTSFDSMVASFLIDASRSSHSLDSLALGLLGRTNISIKELIGSGKTQRTFDTVPLEQATVYAAEDADVALQLHDLMRPQLNAMGLTGLFSEVELPLVEVLAELEWNGILVDPAELERQRLRLQARIDELRALIDDTAMQAIGRTFNPDSPKQLAAVLFGKPTDPEPGLGLKPGKRTQTGYSTDIEVLEKLAQDTTITTPMPSLIVEYRQLTKLVGTYLVSLADEINPDTRRIHSPFNQTVAVTGRLASSDPNLQNIPIRTEIGREIRRAFVAPPGCMLVSADYSQIELRILAHLSRDAALIQAFHEGQDIHTAVAAQIHNIRPDEVTRQQRSGAKMVNFGIVYGVTPYGLARRLGIDNTAAEQIISGYKKRFAGITTFLEECVAQAKRFGYVETMLKRRRPIPEIDSTNPARRSFAERTAINSVVQGSAADLIKLAMVEIHETLLAARAASDARLALLAPCKMLLQIHDELVFEAPAEIAETAKQMIVQKMEGAMTLSVPLKVDASIASNWFEGK